MIIYIIGLSGAGKTTLAKNLYKSIKKKAPNVLWFDGDSLKKIIPSNGKHDLKSRTERYKKMIQIAKFAYDQKINVIVSTLYFNNFFLKIIKNYLKIIFKYILKLILKI